MIELKRICAKCKKEIIISRQNIEEAIHYQGSTYHYKCFIELCERKRNNKRTSAKWSDVYNNLDDILKSSYDWFDNSICKEEIYKLIQNHYDISVVPSSVFTRLSDIYKGKYKGMGEGISPSHFLDMWRRKLSYLDKTFELNKKKGVDMSVDQRLIYDIAILVNKYDSYKKWLEEQEILSAEQASKKINNKRNAEIRIITKPVRTLNNNITEKDMNDLVDDIFD